MFQREGAIHLSERPDLTPRTRHLSVKCHQFKENIGLDKKGNGVTIHWIPAHSQIGDAFTEGVGPLKFKPSRDRLMGWFEGDDESQNYDVRKGELKNVSSDTPVTSDSTPDGPNHPTGETT